MIFLVLVVISLILVGIAYSMLYFLKKSSFLSSLDDEEIKLGKSKNWSSIDVYDVKGTRFYSIIKTKDERYFLINNFSPKLSAINVFKTVDKWYAFSINKLEAKRLRETNAYDYTFHGLATLTTLLGIYVTQNSVIWHYWLTDKVAICIFITLSLIGVAIGIIRMQIDINKFKEKEKAIFANAKKNVVKIKSKEKYILYFIILWLLQFYWLPISINIKVCLIPIVFEELIVRLYSSIGKVKKKKFDEDVSWINQKLYGKDAYYTDISTPSEIFNDYQEDSK